MIVPEYGGCLKIRGTILGVPIIRAIIFWGVSLFWETTIAYWVRMVEEKMENEIEPGVLKAVYRVNKKVKQIVIRCKRQQKMMGKAVPGVRRETKTTTNHGELNGK